MKSILHIHIFQSVSQHSDIKHSITRKHTGSQKKKKKKAPKYDNFVAFSGSIPKSLKGPMSYCLRIIRLGGFYMSKSVLEIQLVRKLGSRIHGQAERLQLCKNYKTMYNQGVESDFQQMEHVQWC